jgi:hypothetical protein
MKKYCIHPRNFRGFNRQVFYIRAEDIVRVHKLKGKYWKVYDPTKSWDGYEHINPTRSDLPAYFPEEFGEMKKGSEEQQFYGFDDV